MRAFWKLSTVLLLLFFMISALYCASWALWRESLVFGAVYTLLAYATRNER